MKNSTFYKAAIASGLISKEEIEEALAALRAANKERGVTSPIGEKRLAAKLVEMGRINGWHATQLLLGRSKFTLGPYRILDSLGQGGMASVFKAEHSIMRRVVAIKVLPRGSTEDAIESFHREIQTLAQLDHENLVRAYDAGVEGKTHFLVTEFVPGSDLRKFIKRHAKEGLKLTMTSAAAIISQAARGLEYAHKRGLIHRDVKPGNLLLTPEGKAKVSDLGLAGFLHEIEGDLRDARDGRIVGTPDYLSPEQIMAPEKVGPASDIYALGCTLYYSISGGKVPFPGGTPRDKARQHCKSQPLDPRRLNPDLADEFVDVIADMMNKDPDERINNCAEVIRRLAPWAGDNWTENSKAVGAMSEAAFSLSGIWPAPVQVGPRDLGDTRPLLDEPGVDFAESDKPSSASQPTQPLTSAKEETSRMNDVRPKEGSGFSGLIVAIVVVGLGAAAAVLSAVLSRLF